MASTEVRVKTRVIQKHGTSSDWSQATSFIPLQGEIIIYDDLKKFKIGDGTTTVSNLAFSELGIETVVAGSGLTGGGSSDSVTLNVGQGDGITVAADSVAHAVPSGATAKTYSGGKVTGITTDKFGHVTGVTTATDADTKVTQTVTSTNANYPLLLAPSGQTASTTTTSYFDSGVTLNPSTNTIAANISGNAATASKADQLTTARSITLSGDVSGTADFNGSEDITITAELSDTGVTAGSYGPTANATPSHGATFNVPAITVDADGRVTAASTYTVKIPSESGDIKGVTAGSGLTGGGTSGTPTLNVGQGDGIVVTADAVAVNTSYTTSDKNYAVKVDDTSGGLYVNVPWTDNDTTYTFTNKDATLAWGSESTIATVGGTDITVTMPSNPNTHYTASLYATSSTGTSNATSATSNPYLTLMENGAARSRIQLKGSGATSVSADDGIVTISSTNTTYTGANGVSISGTTISNSGVRSIATGDTNGTIKVNTNGTNTNIAVKGLGDLAFQSTISSDDITSLDASKLTGTVPTAVLPSYVDDVIEGTYVSSTSFKNTSGIALTGETGKIYVDTTSNKTYRWSGSSFVEISASLALGTTSSTAFRGDYGNTAYNHAVAKGSAFSSGLYKITTNAQGHVTAAEAVIKADITALGIPGSDMNYYHTPSYSTGLKIAEGTSRDDLYVPTMSGATANTAGTTGLVPAPGSGANTKYLRGDGTWVTPTDTTYDVATSTTAGLMSAADKTKLAGIATGATANTGTITGVSANGTSIATNGVANIPAASTSAYGVTKLSSSTSSTSTSLAATASAVKAAYDLAASKTSNVGTITGVTAGNGLTDGGTSGTVTLNVGAGTGITVEADTVSAKLRSTTKLTNDSAAATEVANRVYPVAVDKSGYLAVNVPWSNTDTHYSAYNYIGAIDTAANGTTGNGATYLKLYENGTQRSQFKISGTGAAAVSSDASGNLTIAASNYYHSPSYASGLKIAEGVSVNDLYVPAATTSQTGVVKLTNSTSSTSTTTAATPNSVKTAYDLASSANTTASTAISNIATLYGDDTAGQSIREIAMAVLEEELLNGAW